MKVFGIAGHSGGCKTTLLERLIPEISSRGLVVSPIKHIKWENPTETVRYFSSWNTSESAGCAQAAPEIPELLRVATIAATRTDSDLRHPGMVNREMPVDALSMRLYKVCAGTAEETAAAIDERIRQRRTRAALRTHSR